MALISILSRNLGTIDFDFVFTEPALLHCVNSYLPGFGPVTARLTSTACVPSMKYWFIFLALRHVVAVKIPADYDFTACDPTDGDESWACVMATQFLVVDAAGSSSAITRRRLADAMAATELADIAAATQLVAAIDAEETAAAHDVVITPEREWVDSEGYEWTQCEDGPSREEVPTLIFSINPGRSGSRYLFKVLQHAARSDVYHESALNMHGHWIDEIERKGLAASMLHRDAKVDAIKKRLRTQRDQHDPGVRNYIETNHMFVESFWDGVFCVGCCAASFCCYGFARCMC